MELVNQSGLAMEVTTAYDASGIEHLLLVAKATYAFDDKGRVSSAQRHHDVAYTDVFVDNLATSAPLYEADLVLRKAHCDVILNATAYAPEGRPIEELQVGAKVGAMSKQFMVLGDRVWQKGALTVSASRAKPFSQMPLHYGRAFGGSPSQQASDGSIMVDAYEANPVGVGYSRDTGADAVDGMPLPNTEELADRVRSPRDKRTPQSFGPIGRHWTPRRNYAGSYGAAWRDDISPLLPADFDELFFQCAPPDQQIAFPKGGEQVGLQHLVDGHPLVVFDLPEPDLLVKVLHTSQAVSELTPVVDTVYIEPNKQLLTLVYRTSMPLDRSGLFGLRLVAAGPVCDRWWDSKGFGSHDCGCGGNSDQDVPHRPDPPDEQDDDDGEEDVLYAP